MNSVLKAQLSYLLRHLFRIREFLISPPSPLRWGKVGMGVDIVDIPPTLILPLRGGRKLFFLTQLGFNGSLYSLTILQQGGPPLPGG